MTSHGDDGGLRDTFWERHANPKSGWSRTLTIPLLVYAIYHRQWRLLGLTVVFAAVDPVLLALTDSGHSPPAWSPRWSGFSLGRRRRCPEPGGSAGSTAPKSVCGVVPGDYY